MSKLSELLHRIPDAGITHLSAIGKITEYVSSIGGGKISAGTIQGLFGSKLGQDMIKVLEGIAESRFPAVAPGMRVAVAAAMTFNPKLITWWQGFANQYYGSKIADILKAAPDPNRAGGNLYRGSQDDQLSVDGAYGDRTQAVLMYFETENGLKADGWLGTIVRKFIEDKLGVVAPPVPVIDPQTSAS